MIDDVKYLDAARDGDEGSARTAVEDAVFDSLIFYANRNGLKYIEPSDPDALRYHGTSYPTFSLPDRSVSMGVTRTDIYVYKGRVWIGSALERLRDGVIIDVIVSEPGARRQGKASELMKKFMGAAEEAGVFIKLEVAEMSIEVKRGEKKNLNNAQLRSWYERLGFRKVDEHGLIMSWEPSHRVDLTPILRDRSGEVVPLSKRFLSEMKEMDRDAEYLDAVESGDMKTAQRLVDEAASSAGYTTRAYHGSPEEAIEEFNGSHTSYGIFFTPDPDTAEFYKPREDSGKVYDVYLRISNPVNLDDPDDFYKVAKEAIWDENVERENSGDKKLVSDFLEHLLETYREDSDIWSFFESNKWPEWESDIGDGYTQRDAIEGFADDLYFGDIEELVEKVSGRFSEIKHWFNDEFPLVSRELNRAEEAYGSQEFYMQYQDDFLQAAENMGYDGVYFSDPSSTGESVSIVVFSPRQIKSAEPVVKDSDGNVIPLSKRFNSNSPRITESKENHDKEYLDAVESGDMDTAQRLVDEAAKKAGYDVGPVWHGTQEEFNVFDRDKMGQSGTAASKKAWFFTSNESVAKLYPMDRGGAKRTVRAFLSIPSMVTKDFTDIPSWAMGTGHQARNSAIQRAIRSGKSGVFFRNAYDLGDRADHYAVFSSSQIKSADPVTRDDAGNVIPLSKRFNSNSPRITESNENLLAWFGDSKVRDANGAPLRVYHGTTRPDRVGTRFRKDRATSGPMTFFTDSPDIAGGYANKRDNSLTREHEDSSWEDLFYAMHNGQKVTLRNLWGVLDENTRRELEEKLPKITNYNEEDEDDDDRSLHIGTGVAPASNWEYETRRRRNVLLAAVEIWLYSGLIFGDEAIFIDVLETAGLHGVQYEDLNKTYPAIVPVYLRIEHPLETVNIPEEVFDALRSAGSVKKRLSRRSPADRWDKVSVDSAEWADRLLWDRENGTTYAWATIPDWVVKVLKSFGYDGVKDVGGKYIGEYGGHTVWIPFEPNQVKSATGNRGTFSRRKNSIVERLLTLLEDITGELDFDSGVTDNLTLVSGGDAVGPEYHGWYAYRYGGKVIAYVNYSYYEGKNYVKMIEVDPKFRNMGVARKLLQVLKSESGNKPIHVFGDVVTDDGAAHLNKMRREGIVSRRSR